MQVEYPNSSRIQLEASLTENVNHLYIMYLVHKLKVDSQVLRCTVECCLDMNHEICNSKTKEITYTFVMCVPVTCTDSKTNFLCLNDSQVTDT